jgi:hypothetical protein
MTSDLVLTHGGRVGVVSRECTQSLYHTQGLDTIVNKRLGADTQGVRSDLRSLDVDAMGYHLRTDRGVAKAGCENPRSAVCLVQVHK